MSKGYTLDDKKLTTGRIEIGQIETELSKEQLLQELKEYNLTCKLYIAGKKGDKLYYGKPIIYDTNNSHFMFPNEARLRNMTYGFTIHYDIDVKFKILIDKEDGSTGKNKFNVHEEIITIDKVYFGRLFRYF